MAITFSTPLKDSILETGSLEAALITGGGSIVVYSGTVPTNADAGIGAAVPIVTYTGDGNAAGAGNSLTFGDAANGVLPKAGTWSGSTHVSNSNDDATFWRWMIYGEATGAATVEIRMQGSIGGPPSDLFVQSIAFATNTVYTVDYFSVSVPL